MRRPLAVAAATLAGLGTTALLGIPSAGATASSIAFSATDLSTYQTNGIVWSLATAGNTVFAGGTFTSVRPSGAAAGTGEQPATNFVALDAATGMPTSCKLSFTNSSNNATVRAMAVSPDQTTLYVGGSFGSVSNGTKSVGVSNLAAVNIASCTPVATFHPSVPAAVRALATSGSTVYLGGDFTSVGATATTRQTRNRVAAVNSAGALLPFTTSVDKPVRALAVTPAGDRVAVGGDFVTVNGAQSHALAVVDATTGATDHAFPGFIDPNSVVKALAVSGNALYTGNEGTGGGVFDGRIAVNLDDYSQIWRDTCLGATQTVVVYDNVLYSGSHAHDCSSMGEWPDGRRQHFVAESTSAPVTKLPWYPDSNDGIGEGIGPRALVVAGGGKYLWSGGEFTQINGHAQQGLTRFGTGPEEAAPGSLLTSITSTKAGAVDVRWRSATDNDDATLSYEVYRDNVKVYSTTGDSSWWRRPQLSFTDTGLVPGSSHSYKVRASDGVKTSAFTTPVTVTVASTDDAYASAVRADNPSLYWRLDEAKSSFAADSGSTNNGGVIPAGVTYGTAGPKPGQVGLTLPGTVNLNSELRQTVPGAFSVETWFKTTSTTGGKLIGFGNNPTNNSGSYDKHVYMTNNGQLVFGVYPGGVRTISSPRSYNDGQWHQVVATQGSSGMALYVDGQLVATGTPTTNQAYAGYWRLGGDNLSGWPSAPTNRFFTGSVDEFAVYPTALSAAQVSAHFNAMR